MDGNTVIKLRSVALFFGGVYRVPSGGLAENGVFFALRLFYDFWEFLKK